MQAHLQGTLPGAGGAEKREREAMTAYVEAAASCDYPEVRRAAAPDTRPGEWTRPPAADEGTIAVDVRRHRTINDSFA